LAGFTGILGLITIFWHDWIEAIFGCDPDHHSGAAETGIIVGLFVIAVVFFVVSRFEARRRAAAAAPSR
jgi:uncharacterized membrane protein YtjA (UPF0391 family)